MVDFRIRDEAFWKKAKDVVFYDTETCGLCGPAVLIQYARGSGETHLHNVWVEPIQATLDLIEDMMNHRVCGFNMAFDHFQLCKIFTMLRLFPDKKETPEDIVNELAMLEPIARDGPCLKPKSALDLMLVARRGPYQSCMDRHDVRIKRVPTALASSLAKELEKRVPLKDIYFAKRKIKSLNKWQIFDIKDDDGDVDEDFKDIVLKFNASSALKALVTDALDLSEDEVLHFSEAGIPKKLYPKELEYAPFALASGNQENWNGTWPDVIGFHIAHWLHNRDAIQYAGDDVRYLQMLYEKWQPEFGDDNSELTCTVGACRWRGYALDLEGIKELKEAAEKKQYKGDFKIPTYAEKVRWYVNEAMSDDEKSILADTKKLEAQEAFQISTKKVLLQEITEWKIEGPDNTIIPHPAAARAKDVLNARLAQYESNFFGKLLKSGRLHADFNITGSLSDRMSGSSSSKTEVGGEDASGINSQGIKNDKEVRSKFPLAWAGDILCGGDFAAFEVTLAEAEWGDPGLRKQLLTCERCNGPMDFFKDPVKIADLLDSSCLEEYVKWRLEAEAKKKKKDGNYECKDREIIEKEVLELDFLCKSCGSNEGKKIHALFGINVYKQHTYESLVATKGSKDDLYTRSKQGVFAMMYGAEAYTLKNRLGVPIEIAIDAVKLFHAQFPGIAKSQKRIIKMFQSMRQVGGIGSKIEWHEPAEKIESMFGFPRYFTLENQICKALFDLANKPPLAWRDLKIRVQRRDRIQFISGAVQSALFACAFAIQAANTRAAINHVIQSSGATVNKRVQRRVWDLQPAGVHEWIVQPMNVHDEILCPTKRGHEKEVKQRVIETVESFRAKVPLIKMEWQIGLKTWADK